MTVNPDQILHALNALREPEGSSVTLCNPNPDFNGMPNECVEVVAEWTSWITRQYRADTLALCLGQALDAAPPEVQQDYAQRCAAPALLPDDPAPLTMAEFEAALQRMQAATALIRKLNKTADGVPVIPNEGVLYTRDGREIEWSPDGSMMLYRSGEPMRLVSECYSTRAAALAASLPAEQHLPMAQWPACLLTAWNDITHSINKESVIKANLQIAADMLAGYLPLPQKLRPEQPAGPGAAARADLPCAFCQQVKQTALHLIWSQADPNKRSTRLCSDCVASCAAP